MATAALIGLGMDLQGFSKESRGTNIPDPQGLSHKGPP
jgi:hypothetical protein